MTASQVGILTQTRETITTQFTVPRTSTGQEEATTGKTKKQTQLQHKTPLSEKRMTRQANKQHIITTNKILNRGSQLSISLQKTLLRLFRLSDL